MISPRLESTALARAVGDAADAGSHVRAEMRFVASRNYQRGAALDPLPRDQIKKFEFRATDLDRMFSPLHYVHEACRLISPH